MQVTPNVFVRHVDVLPIRVHQALVGHAAPAVHQQAGVGAAEVDRQPVAGFYLGADVALALAWSRALTINELQQLQRNPWQLFAPESRKLYFGASGGGANIFESTFATSWSLSDTYSASATLVSTYADSPTVTDSSSSSTVFSSAFAETIPVSDGPSADKVSEIVAVATILAE